MEKEFKSCCFTGYRPAKFPFLLEPSDKQYIEFENRLTQAIFSLSDEDCYTFYSGMAMGFDIIAAETVLLFRDANKNAAVSLICVFPFIEQAKSFPQKWKERYNSVIAEADKVILTSDNYFSGCYQKRNRFMVDNSDFIITWFDGCSGGTKNTIAYAAKKGRDIINIYDNQMAFIIKYCKKV